MGCNLLLGGVGNAGGPTVLVLDTFSGSGNLSGRTPDTTDTPGNNWVQQDGIMTAATDHAFCDTYSGGNTADATIDCGKSDVTLSGSVYAGSASTSAAGWNVCYADGNNLWQCRLSGFSGNLEIYEVSGGTSTLRASASPTWSAATYYGLSVQKSGTSITATLTGASPSPETISYGSMGSGTGRTVHGLRGVSSGSDVTAWKNFEVTNP